MLLSVSDPAFAAFINGLINRPWSRKRHCWWLVREVVGRLGHELPPVLSLAPLGPQARDASAKLFAGHQERRQWRETAEPSSQWAVALLGRPWRPAEAEHCGVWLALDGGGVLHTENPHGVVFDNLMTLAAVRQWTPVFLEPA